MKYVKHSFPNIHGDVVNAKSDRFHFEGKLIWLAKETKKYTKYVEVPKIFSMSWESWKMMGKFKGMQDWYEWKIAQEEDKAEEEGAILSGVVHWRERLSGKGK